MKPKLRFKEFTDDWEEKKLGEIAQFFSGGTPKSTNKEYYIGNIPFIRSGEINEIDTELFINELALKNSSAKLVHQGDILYAMYGATAGNVSISKIDGAINQAILCIRTLENSIYIQQYLKRNKEKYLNIYLQGGQGNLSANIISGFKIQLPSLPEQEKIATFLSLVDQRIEKQERKVALLEEEKKGYMQQIFNQELRFKDEEGNNYPDWEEKKLGDIAEYCKDKNNHLLYHETFTNSAELGIISQHNFFDKNISNKNNIDGYYLVHPNDFVYNPRISNLAPFGPIRRNKLGKIGIISPLYLVFKIKNQNHLFMEQYFYTSNWHNYVYSIGDTGARADRVSIKKCDFFNMPIQLPSLSEQEKIANFLSLLDQRIEKEQEKLRLLKEEKKGLLQQMFV